VREHALNGTLDRETRAGSEQFVVANARQATRVPRVTDVFLLALLAAGHPDLARVDDDDEVTRIDVRGKDRLVLAAEEARGVSGDTSEDAAVCIQDVPTTLDVS